MLDTHQVDNPIILEFYSTSVTQVHYLPTMLLLRVNYLLVTAHGPHQRKEQPTLKPDESREVIFTLPLYIREMIPTEKSYLTIKTEFSLDIVKTSFYHTDRKYSIPPHIKRLDEPFTFVFLGGGAYD